MTSLNILIRDCASFALLSRDDEVELSEKVKNGDTDAKDIFIKSNIRLVIDVAKKFTNRGVLLEDLIENGVIGLIRAVELYDASHNVRFSSYAVHWIKNYIRLCIIRESRLIRIPNYIYAILPKWKKAKLEFENSGKSPTLEEIAEKLGIPYKQIPSIETALITIENENSLGNASSIKRQKSEEEKKVFEEEYQKVEHHLSKLSEREQIVIKYRFGLEGEERTLSDIGKMFGLTRERIRQIEKTAIRKLGEKLKVNT